METNQNIEPSRLAESCTGMPYGQLKKMLVAAGYYQTELRPLRMRPNSRSTWYLGRNEYRGILEVVYDWHEQPSGIAVPGNVVSATWTPPMRERATK